MAEFAIVIYNLALGRWATSFAIHCSRLTGVFYLRIIVILLAHLYVLTHIGDLSVGLCVIVYFLNTIGH